MLRKAHLWLISISVSIMAFVCLDYWSSRNAPLYLRLERVWREDVEILEASRKLPPGWSDLGEIEVFGGTPETKDWLSRIQIPIKTIKTGRHKMEILIVVWDEDGKRGTLVQYNLINLKTGNNIWELGRTFILSRPRPSDWWSELINDLN